MKKPRSQHAHFLDWAARYRRWAAVSHPSDTIIPIYKKKVRRLVGQARAIRLATDPDPLWIGTLHPYDPVWFEWADPPDPPGR